MSEIAANTLLHTEDFLGNEKIIQVKDLQPGYHLRVVCLDPATGMKTFQPLLGLRLVEKGASVKTMALHGKSILTCSVQQAMCVFQTKNEPPLIKNFDSLSDDDCLMVSTGSGKDDIELISMRSFDIDVLPERQDIYDVTTSCHYPFFAGVVLVESDDIRRGSK